MSEQNKNRGASTSGNIGFAGFIVRLLAALILVMATYNPTEFSFYDWVQQGISEGSLGPLHFLAGIILIIGWTVYWVASYRALGALGLILGTAFLVTLVWLLIDFGILKLESAATVTWIVLICISVLLAIGVSWAHAWRRLTGQLEVDETN